MTDHDAIEPLSDLFGALSHPDRIRLILALHQRDQDVATLAEALDLSQPRTSQHLALLRAHHVVSATRDGRRAVYGLTQPDLAAWMVSGARFLVEDAERQADMAAHLTRWMQRLLPR